MRDIYAPLKSTKEENITPIINSWKATKMKSHCVATLSEKQIFPKKFFFVLVNVLLLPIYLSCFTTKKWTLRLFWLLGWPLLFALTLKLNLMLWK